MSSSPANFCQGCGQSISITALWCPHCGAPQAANNTSTPFITAQSLPDFENPPVKRKSKLAAALLALFLGGIGIHKFYMGSWGWGLVYLVLFWTWLPALAALAEGIRYLVLSEQEFQRKAVRLAGPFSFLW